MKTAYVNHAAANIRDITYKTPGVDANLYTTTPARANRINKAINNDETINWDKYYRVAVKWRQLVSVNDSVFYINKIGRFEDTDSIDGFGLSTPLVSQHLRVVRYYPYYFDMIKCMKKFMFQQLKNRIPSRVHQNKNLLLKLTKLKDIYNIVGSDFFIVTDIQSDYKPDKKLSGTRIVLKRFENSFVPGAYTYEFLIRTATTLTRWKEYESELNYHFQQLFILYQKCLLNDTSKSYRLLDLSKVIKKKNDVVECALRIFYWIVNFSPLARGSAATAYVTMHAVLLLFHLKIKTNSIPKRFQLDFVALFSSKSDDFIRKVKQKWFNVDKNLEFIFNEKNIDINSDELSNVPSVARTFSTYREMYEAINDSEMYKITQQKDNNFLIIKNEDCLI